MSGPLSKMSRALVDWAKSKGPLSQLPASNRQQMYSAMFNKEHLADSAIPELEFMHDPSRVGNPLGKVDYRVARALREADTALRYETTGVGAGRGTKHFDLVGGRQMAAHIPSVFDLAEQRINDLDLLSPENFYASSRLRLSPLSLLDEAPNIVGDDFRSSSVARNKPSLYANIFEGADKNLAGARDDSSLIFDLLEDMQGMPLEKLLSPSVRDYYNMSVAVPSKHPLYTKSVVLKRGGGVVR